MDETIRLIMDFSKSLTKYRDIRPILDYLKIKNESMNKLDKYQSYIFDLLYIYFNKNLNTFPSPHYKYILNKPCHQIDPNIIYNLMQYIGPFYLNLGIMELTKFTDDSGKFSPIEGYKTINKALSQKYVLKTAFIDLDAFKILKSLTWPVDKDDELEDSGLMNYCNPQNLDLEIHRPLEVGGDCDRVGMFLCSFWEREKYHDLAKPYGFDWLRGNKQLDPSACNSFVDDERDSDEVYCKKLIKSHPEYKPVEQINHVGFFETLIPMNQRFCLNADDTCPLSQTKLQYLDVDKIVKTSSNYCYAAEDFANYLYYNDFANKDPIDPNLLIYENFEEMKKSLFKANISDEIKTSIDDRIQEIKIRRPQTINGLLTKLPRFFYDIISVSNICMSDKEDDKGFPNSIKALRYLYSVMDTLEVIEVQSIVSSDGVTLETFRNMVENGYCIHRAGMLLFAIAMNALSTYIRAYPTEDIILPGTFMLENNIAVTFHEDTISKNSTMLVPVGIDCIFSRNNQHFPNSFYGFRVSTGNTLYDNLFAKFTQKLGYEIRPSWIALYNETKEEILKK